MCQLVPDKLLKDLGDHKSLKISKALRSSRNRLKRFFKKVTYLVASRLETYDCKNGTKLPGVTADLPSDKVAQAAQSGANSVFHFYQDFFNRNSLDDKGMALISSVHYDKDYNNAFWNGEQMIYGDGDGQIFIPLALAVDVCGHELTHGVVQNTAGLVYYYQPGAANESFADIFGVTLKQYLAGQKDPVTANWLVGDAIVGPKFPGKALRSFKDEKAYSGDDQPKYMKNFVYTASDNFGVHTNSGIMNHGFYQVCLALNEPSFGKPIQIMYATLLNIGKYSGFKTIAKTAVKQAEKLYGKDVAAKVKEAYAKVGL